MTMFKRKIYNLFPFIFEVFFTEFLASDCCIVSKLNISTSFLFLLPSAQIPVDFIHNLN